MWQVLLVCGMVSASIPVVHRVREFVRVDGCLDRGGVYDYASEQCRTDPSGPVTFAYVAYSSRHPDLPRWSFGVASAFLAVAGLAFFRRA